MLFVCTKYTLTRAAAQAFVAAALKEAENRSMRMAVAAGG